MLKNTTNLLRLLGFILLIALCSACYKNNTHLPLLIMPIHGSNEVFHLNKTENEYYGAASDNKSCSGALLGNAIVLGGDNKFKLPKEIGLTSRSAAEIAYAHKFVSATDIHRIQCIRTKIFGNQNNIEYVSNSVDFPVNCNGICPDHCTCTYNEKAINEKAFLSKLN